MKSFLIACLAAALMASSQPARAQGLEAEQIGGILAGLLTLGLIAKAIDDHKDRKAATVTRQTPRFAPAPARPGNAAWRLPEQCLRQVDIGGRLRPVYGRHCLKRNYRFADRLPAACERDVRTERGWRTVYGARCLQRSGFESGGYRGRN